ncbi:MULTISPECIES: hypothetical protein [Rhodomicrobium]|uniref:hypothetical protein n=1 Tax=Rhodomicrobium TaxID=1068 RepID=UPI000F741E1A|nr:MULTISPECIES: hypothetical protein [Rhodomicrobium]
MVLKTLEELRGGLRDALSAGENVVERLAIAEVDAVIQTRVGSILIPSIIVGLLFAIAELAVLLIGDPETQRLAVTSILLAAGVYGLWTLATGIIEILPVMAVWASTRVSPHKLARLLLYQLILSRLRDAFTNAEGRPSTAGHIARYALKFSGRPSSWEGLAYRLADQIAPRMVRHAVLRVVMVIIPVAAAWAYYRFQIFPGIIRSETGLGIWSAFAYPLAALLDAITGTDLRGALLRP